MKRQYYEVPEKMKMLESWGFNWLEFVTSIPSPLLLVTSYKSNGKPNACMQSWATFTTGDKGNRYFALFSSVNKNGHLYKTLQEKKCAVINFMNSEFYDKSIVRKNAKVIHIFRLGILFLQMSHMTISTHSWQESRGILP